MAWIYRIESKNRLVLFKVGCSKISRFELGRLAYDYANVYNVVINL